jgi:hypothetical protein
MPSALALVGGFAWNTSGWLFEVSAPWTAGVIRTPTGHDVRPEPSRETTAYQLPLTAQAPLPALLHVRWMAPLLALMMVK